MLSDVERSVVESIDVEELRQLCIEAVMTPSYSPPYGLEEDIANLFAKKLEGIGAEVELQEVRPKRPNVIGRLRGKGGGNTVLFNGHLDTTVPCLGWTRDPVGGSVEGDKLSGHGI